MMIFICFMRSWLLYFWYWLGIFYNRLLLIGFYLFLFLWCYLTSLYCLFFLLCLWRFLSVFILSTLESYWSRYLFNLTSRHCRNLWTLHLHSSYQSQQQSKHFLIILSLNPKIIHFFLDQIHPKRIQLYFFMNEIQEWSYIKTVLSFFIKLNHFVLIRCHFFILKSYTFYKYLFSFFIITGTFDLLFFVIVKEFFVMMICIVCQY